MRIYPFRELIRGICHRMALYKICHCECNEAIPKIGVRTTIQSASTFIAGIATVATLLRNDTMPDKTVGVNLSADVGHFTCYRKKFKI